MMDTQNGRVIGTHNGDISDFLGLPYAAAPVDALRFRPPGPHASWSIPLQTTTYGPVCPQTAALGTPGVDEDCLTLNVFRPDRGGSNRPVLVFFYGGSFRYGGAGLGVAALGPNYDGSQIAERTGAVVVTVNYRLGVLGFLALPALDADDPRHVSGNYGLLDQQAALRWVHDNATSLGVDPSRVTVFGQSAGALSIVEQMASPAAKGLFSSVWLESVGALPAETLARAEISDAAILGTTGCSTAADAAACLRTVSVATLLKSDVTVGPAIDGIVIPAAPANALSQGAFSQVPVALMTDADEGTYFIAEATTKKSYAVTSDELGLTLAANFGSADAASIAAAYPTSRYGRPGQTLAAILTDEFFSCPAASLRGTLESRVSTLQFEFAQPDPVHDYPIPTAPGIVTGDAHTAELAYVFGHDGAGDPLPVGASRTLSDGIIDALGLFAQRSGKLPDTGDQVISLSNASHMSNDFSARHQCEFWTRLGAKPILIGKII
ncbi:MAG: carboxylesterase/lipase family protein [Janthinobacterium lividum]